MPRNWKLVKRPSYVAAKRKMARKFKPRLRGKTRPRRSLALQQHNFVERTPDVILALNNSTLDAAGNLSSTHTNTFQLSDIPQVAHYAALFEYYRIDKVVIIYRYKTAGVPAGYIANPLNTQLSQEINPTLLFKVDHNDVIAQSVADLKLSARTKEKQLTNNKPNFSIQVKPAIQTEAYKSLTASTYVPKWGQWLTMVDTTVPHYGLKMNIQCPRPNPNYDYGSIEIQKKIYFTVKNNE